MNPRELGEKYDKIAKWWNDQHKDSSYGIEQVKRAIRFAQASGKALDVGCGAGGRFIRLLERSNFKVTGVDVSKNMINLARENHPDHHFINEDIALWYSDQRFDFILAWDSIFHLPLSMQKPVLDKLCNMLADDGVLIYTFGNDEGEHTDTWKGDLFHYSSLGTNNNLELLIDHGLKVLHLELDQFPEQHAFVIAKTQPKES